MTDPNQPDTSLVIVALVFPAIMGLLTYLLTRLLNRENRDRDEEEGHTFRTRYQEAELCRRGGLSVPPDLAADPEYGPLLVAILYEVKRHPSQ